MYDCIIILGGSIKNNGDLPNWVINRLDEALNNPTKYYIVTSRGTTHKPPPIDKNNMPIDEANRMAQYLIAKGINSEKIFLESWSMDTIGNAYGVLMMHCIPRNFKKILVITSDFHIRRSESIFRKVFSLPKNEFILSFISSNSELKESEKEIKSLEKWKKNSKKIKNLQDLHNFIFVDHNAYNAFKKDEEEWSKENLKMYCI
jgi:hypothetical protein